MKISLSSVLVLALAAESTVASSWFGTRAGTLISMPDALFTDSTWLVQDPLNYYIGRHAPGFLLKALSTPRRLHCSAQDLFDVEIAN